MRSIAYIISVLVGLSIQVIHASASSTKDYLQIPQCLAKHVSAHYDRLAENEAFSIIAVPSEELESIVILADRVHCGRFMNVTSKIYHQSEKIKHIRAKHLLALSLTPAKKTIIESEYGIHHPSFVFEAMNAVDKDSIWATLTHLTQYKNRSALRQTGVNTAHWLKSRFDTFVAQSMRQDCASYMVKTGLRYRQPSLVTVIGKDKPGPAVVIGAHMDTLDGRMPGAGDDASGSASLMEMARVLTHSSRRLDHPVYLIWYAAEERGLVGSQYVVSHFLQESIPVKAVMQLDMTGFRNDPSDSTMWVYRDYTDDHLSDFVAELIHAYLNVPVGESKCGYACSDHASWMEKGIPAVFPCETDFEHHNVAIHSSDDTIDKLSPEHMINFTKLGLAFVIELAKD